MIQILQQLAHLNTVRESLDIISNSITSLKEGVNNIDLSSVIDKIEETTAGLSNKIEGVQIDTTDLAKELTLTEVNSKLDNLPSGGGGSLALEQFFGLSAALPEGYEFMTAEEVCAELEEIMTTMDIELTQEMAEEITNNTLNN